MGQDAAQVIMSFQPLLERIAEHLNSPPPVYATLNADTNKAYVSITPNRERLSYLFLGGQAASLELSKEKAARKAVLSLMLRYEIYVEDVTALKTQELDRCIALYKMKQEEAERLEQGLPSVRLFECILGQHYGYPNIVQADFLSILRVALDQFGVLSTNLETLEHGPGGFTSWMTVTTIGLNPQKCLFGECMSTIEFAKQNLAKKVIKYLAGIYNFEVVDANYDPARIRNEALAFDFERAKFLAVKTRVYGIEEDVQPTPAFIEEDCLTPRATLFRIAASETLPLPPQKRKRELTIEIPTYVYSEGETSATSSATHLDS